MVDSLPEGSSACQPAELWRARVPWVGCGSGGLTGEVRSVGSGGEEAGGADHAPTVKLRAVSPGKRACRRKQRLPTGRAVVNKGAVGGVR